MSELFFTGSVCGVKQPEALCSAYCEVLREHEGQKLIMAGDKQCWGCGDMTSNGKKEHQVVGLRLTQLITHTCCV